MNIVSEVKSEEKVWISKEADSHVCKLVPMGSIGLAWNNWGLIQVFDPMDWVRSTEKLHHRSRAH